MSERPDATEESADGDELGDGDASPSREDFAGAADPDPSTVFDLLGDETRLAIVRTLARLSAEQWARGSVSYSALREAVGVEDGGRFNYHLGELRDVLVTRDGDEYRLTGRGRRIARFLRSGRARRGPDVRGEGDAVCGQCGRQLSVRLYDGVLWTECPEHARCWDMILPPGAGERHDPATLERLATGRGRWYVELARHGACHECWGEVETSIVDADDEVPVDWDGPCVEIDCDRCRLTYWLPPQTYLVAHPAVVAFWWERGVDVRWQPLTGNPTVNEEYVAVERTARGALVEFRTTDATLALSLDADATVVEAERRSADSE